MKDILCIVSSGIYCMLLISILMKDIDHINYTKIDMKLVHFSCVAILASYIIIGAAIVLL